MIKLFNQSQNLQILLQMQEMHSFNFLLDDFKILHKLIKEYLLGLFYYFLNFNLYLLKYIELESKYSILCNFRQEVNLEDLLYLNYPL